jgi:hypothetical protein
MVNANCKLRNECRKGEISYTRCEAQVIVAKRSHAEGQRSPPKFRASYLSPAPLVGAGERSSSSQCPSSANSLPTK